MLRSERIGGRMLRSAIGQARNGHGSISARAFLIVMKFGLSAAAQVHLGAGNKEAALTAARIANLIFRAEIRARQGVAALLYFETLLLCAWHKRLAREAPEPEPIDGYFFNFAIGSAHLYLINPDAALYFLERAVIQSQGRESLALRRLGCAYLAADDKAKAIDCFQRSAEVDPRTVMAHQNHAARYDIGSYSPPQWEFRNAGRLMVYDNLIQLGEEFYRQGQLEPMLRFYGHAFKYQDVLQQDFPLPDDLVARIAAECPAFDSKLPIRLLGYEWVTQIGHIGFLDHYMRVALLGLLPKANYVLLAPRQKIVNAAMLRYWNEFYCIVEDERLIADLFPYQRMVGDQFIAARGGEKHAVAWSELAAQGQWQWAEQHRGPLIQLSDQDRQFGRDQLERAGIQPDDWYVSLHVREGGYYGDGPGTIAAHRSANIDEYFDAIEEITSRGGWVIRLGDATMKKLPRMTRVIDYAHSEMKSQRMDVFLFATSRFVIGTTSGPTNAVQSFGTPMLVTNAISNDSQPWTANTKFILKHIYDRRNKRRLTLAEIYRQPLRSFLINSELLRRHGYEVRSNKPNEIRLAVQEMLAAGPDVTPQLSDYRAAIAATPYLFGAAQPIQELI